MLPGNDTDDLALFNLMRMGFEPAFDEIYKRYWKKLFNEAYKRLGSIELSEEIVQDVFTDLWIKKEKKQIDNLFAYLLTAVRYQVYMQFKNRKRIPFFEQPLEHMAEASLQADSVYFEKELQESIAIWLQEQPEKRREIFKLRFMEGISTREISELLNISQKTVQNQLTTSLYKLRISLTKLMMALLF
jgi:RNA polymerase sigma-70 factor (ECF subfamily)